MHAAGKERRLGRPVLLHDPRLCRSGLMLTGDIRQATRVLNWAARYLPVVRLLDEIRATSALDVGGGWYGLSWYRRGTAVQADFAFPAPYWRPPGETWPRQPAPSTGAPTTATRPGVPLYVQASASALPFPSRAFDAVVSLDLIEHLPEALRSIAVAEMARVARNTVIIGFPVGRFARWTDAAVEGFFRVMRWQVPAWLVEHRSQVHYPSRETLIGVLPSGWDVTREMKNNNVLAFLAVVIIESVAGRDGKHLPGLGRNWKWPAVLDRGPTYRRIFVLSSIPAPTG